MQYSATKSFLQEGGDYQYTLNTDAKRTLKDSSGEDIDITGVEITTAVASPIGFEEIVSFVPYRDQI